MRYRLHWDDVFSALQLELKMQHTTVLKQHISLGLTFDALSEAHSPTSNEPGSAMMP